MLILFVIYFWLNLCLEFLHAYLILVIYFIIIICLVCIIGNLCNACIFFFCHLFSLEDLRMYLGVYVIM